MELGWPATPSAYPPKSPVVKRPHTYSLDTAILPESEPVPRKKHILVQSESLKGASISGSFPEDHEFFQCRHTLRLQQQITQVLRDGAELRCWR